MTARIAAVLVLAATVAATPPAPEETWPGFRGHEMSGLAPKAKVPDQWSATKNVKWAVPIAGNGWSSPIIWGDTVYVTSAVGGKAFKQPSAGLYGNDYVAELQALLDRAGVEAGPVEFRRYGSARRLYTFDVDDAGAYG